jgi:hypothetical protein
MDRLRAIEVTAKKYFPPAIVDFSVVGETLRSLLLNKVSLKTSGKLLSTCFYNQ